MLNKSKIILQNVKTISSDNIMIMKYKWYKDTITGYTKNKINNSLHQFIIYKAPDVLINPKNYKNYKNYDDDPKNYDDPKNELNEYLRFTTILSQTGRYPELDKFILQAYYIINILMKMIIFIYS